MNWQPIETAPKDGTPVLIYLSDPIRPMVIAWFGPKFSKNGVNYGDDWGVGPLWDDGLNFPPTHWMPLPEPPK